MTATEYAENHRRDTARARLAASLLWDSLGDLAGDLNEVSALIDRVLDLIAVARTSDGKRRLTFLASEIERIADRIHEGNH